MIWYYPLEMTFMDQMLPQLQDLLHRFQSLLIGFVLGWFLLQEIGRRTKKEPPVIHAQPWMKGQTGVWRDKEIQKEKEE